MKKDLEFYASKNIQRIMTRAVGMDEDYLKTFISPMISFYPQLVWNPSLEIHTLLRNFCSDFFGSDQVQMFFERIGNNRSQGYFCYSIFRDYGFNPSASQVIKRIL